MAKYLAIEWDSSELRMATGRTRGNGIAVDQTYAIPIPENASPEAIGTLISESVGAASKGIETLIAIPRASVEIRQLQLPQAPADELPEMVRFQAMRQFSNIADDWPLDYVELDRSDDHVQVLASVVAPDAFRHIQKVCEVSGRVAQHICLRPFASAELLKEHLGANDTCRLIVDVMSQSADLGVLVNGQIAFMRTVRLPPVADDAELPVQGLMGEIRRTIAAASNQLNGQQVAAVTLFGTGSRLEPLRAAIDTLLKLDAEIWNPFTNVRLDSNPPTHPGRFAALLGMMMNQSAGVRQPIDFLNPRRRPKPKSNRERYLLYAFLGIAAVALLAVGSYLLDESKKRTIKQLADEKNASSATVEVAQKLAAQVTLVKAFRDESVNFLEEISEISAVLPGPNDARVQKLDGALSKGVGQLTMDFQVSRFNFISEIENALQRDDRQVHGKRSQERGDKEFPFTFQTVTTIDPVKKREMAEAGRGNEEVGPEKTAPGEPADETPDETPDDSVGDAPSESATEEADAATEEAEPGTGEAPPANGDKGDGTKEETGDAADDNKLTAGTSSTGELVVGE
jgi:Tfp pilus assembly PilM family ATPase